MALTSEQADRNYRQIQEYKARKKKEDEERMFKANQDAADRAREAFRRR